MTDVPDTIARVESLVSNYRKKFVDRLPLDPHVKVNIDVRDELLNNRLPELMGFLRLEATDNEIAATKDLKAAIDAQTKAVEAQTKVVEHQATLVAEQGRMGARLVWLTGALVLVGAVTIGILLLLR